jgi:Transposase DDE domain
MVFSLKSRKEKTMSKHQFTRKAQQMKAFLKDTAEQLSRLNGVVQRQSKLTGSRLVQIVVLGWLDKPTASLNELSQVAADLNVEISAAGIQQRLTGQTVRLLKDLVQQALVSFRQKTRLPEAVLAHFNAVHLLDSSLIALPDHLRETFPGSRKRISPAEMKVQLSFDYLSGNLNAVDVQTGISPDQKCELLVEWAEPGSLSLVDLGYFKKGHLEAIDRKGAYFLSRLQTQTNLYQQAEDSEPIDLPRFLAELPGNTGEVWLYMKADKRAFPVRLVYARLPKAVAEERRRKAHANAKRRGKTCSERHLGLLDYALFVTNVPSDWLSPHQVMLVYRVRWQVELIFKLWKSQAQLDVVSNCRLERVMCQFYARLLGIILFHWSVAPSRILPVGEISLPKAFAVFQRHALRFIDVMRRQGRGLATLLQRITDDFQQFALKTNRRKSPSTFALLVLEGA